MALGGQGAQTHPPGLAHTNPWEAAGAWAISWKAAHSLGSHLQSGGTLTESMDVPWMAVPCAALKLLTSFSRPG